MAAIRAIGILGGTFDPIHYGHLAAAECSRDDCQLDQVLFIPAARPPHKDFDQVLEGSHRYAMAELAIKENPYFEVSSLELERQGVSYTVETVEAYVKNLPGVELFFILGVDALMLLNTWRDVERLATLCRFIVVTRPGYQLNRAESTFQGIPDSVWERMTFLPVPGIYISSSEIRKRVAVGKTIKYLVPPLVEQYIADHNLYKNGEHKRADA